MKKVSELSPITQAIRACDNAANSVADHARKAADAILEMRVKGAETKVEAPRLIEAAKEIVQKDGYQVVNADLFSRYISPLIICGLEGETKLKRKVKTDQGESITVERPVSELTAGSIKSVQKVAKELKDSLGMSDGRANNKGQRKARQPGAETDEAFNATPDRTDRKFMEARVKEWLAHADTEQGLIETCLKLGYSLRKMSKVEREGLPKEQAKS